jgi:hypothetical protein
LKHAIHGVKLFSETPEKLVLEDGNNVPIAKNCTEGCQTSLGLLQNVGPGKADSEAWERERNGLWDVLFWFVLPTETTPVVIMGQVEARTEMLCV